MNQRPVTQFVNISPTLDAYWRAIILFGRNSACYKFALAKSLVELVNQDTTFIPLSDLAEPFSHHVCEHLAGVDRQGTSASSRFLDACRDFNSGTISRDELLEATVRLGFANVIDAFHIVNQAEIPRRFFTDDRKARNGIVITDDLFRLKEDLQISNLPGEVEARWRLVETAWSLNLNSQLLVVSYDQPAGTLYVPLAETGRIDVTSAREALNGYQKGKCFYCFSDIVIGSLDANAPDVDHFFPRVLIQFQDPADVTLDGVWNLVLSCSACNRGQNGKFARVPQLRYLERLHRRNNYLIDSHHPLRETLIEQTGPNAAARRAFLQSMHTFAISILIHQWAPQDEAPATF